MPAHVKTGLRILAGVIIVVAVFLGGVYVGYNNRSASEDNSSVDLSLFWKAWNIVQQNFAPANNAATPVTDQDKVYGAIQGMVAAYGDPYTTFFPPAENTQFQAQIAGSFSGIGVEIGEKNGVLTVIAPLKGTPADKAGIRSGDEIVKIGTTNTADITIDQAVSMIQGKDGTSVTLTLARQGVATPIVTTVVRGTIDLPTVDTETIGNVFVIHFYSFSADSATLFRAAMQKYLASGDHNLLIDVRGNPGGYLDAAVQIGSEFIPQGETIVKEIGKSASGTQTYTSTGPVIFPKGDKLIILADQGSASAAEILSGALSEQHIGVLVGEQTFGKGSVQQVIPLSNDTSLKVTIAHWYTPDGISISEKGLTPQIVIPFDPNAKTDTQLQKAVQLFADPTTFQKYL